MAHCGWPGEGITSSTKAPRDQSFPAIVEEHGRKAGLSKVNAGRGKGGDLGTGGSPAVWLREDMDRSLTR